MATFNANINESGNAADALKEMRKSVETMMNSRFKNNPKKAESEATKLIDKLVQSQKAQDILNNKSAAQRRKEESDNAKKIAQLQLATAEGFKQKTVAAAKLMGENLKDAATEVGSKLLNGAVNIGASFNQGIQEYASLYSKYAASIDARVQGSGESFSEMSKLVRKNLAASPFVKQADMLDNLNKLIDKGIAYNIEQRAFLASVSDKMVTTFDVLDDTLLKMIRLQQSDSTQARLGMEATLTKQLNSMFKDTSYLSNTFDSVTQAIFDASAQMGRTQAVEFEYVVQKWLGSMGSVGVSEQTLTQIAEGLNYLGTGNVEALASNQALQNLFVTAANRAGLEYSQILTQGLNANTANKLLGAIVDYTREISQTSNQVVRAQYGQLFGVTMSDMTAIMNLTSDELLKISNTMLNYSEAIKETTQQLNSIPDRIHISEMIDNVVDNFKTGIAGNIAANAGSYITWQIIDFVEQLTGGIAIPTISVMGSGIDLETTVTGLMKTGMVGVSTIAQIGNILAGLGGKGGLNLDTWGYEDTLRRNGAGFTGITSGYTSSISGSAYIGSSSGSDMASHSVAAASEEGSEQIKSAQEEEDRDPTSTKNRLKTIVELLEGIITGSGDAMQVHITNPTAIPVSIDTLGVSLG